MNLLQKLKKLVTTDPNEEISDRCVIYQRRTNIPEDWKESEKYFNTRIKETAAFHNISYVFSENHTNSQVIPHSNYKEYVRTIVLSIRGTRKNIKAFKKAYGY